MSAMPSHRLAAILRLAALCATALPALPAAARSDPPLASDIAPAPLPPTAPAPRAVPASYRGERAPVDPGAVKDLFERRSWLPPAPPPPPLAPVAAKAPEAPRMPFSYLGVIDGRAIVRQVLIAKGDQLFIVKKSDVLEGTYRIDDITDHAIELTYLPLNQRQSLSTDGATP